MRLAWSMTRLTTGHLVFPTGQTAEFRVGRRRKIPELIFMTVFACFASDVVVRMGRAASAVYDADATKETHAKAQRRKEELPSFFAPLFVPLRLCVSTLHEDRNRSGNFPLLILAILTVVTGLLES